MRSCGAKFQPAVVVQFIIPSRNYCDNSIFIGPKVNQRCEIWDLGSDMSYVSASERITATDLLPKLILKASADIFGFHQEIL